MSEHHELDVHKLTGAYAVDALDDLERARFERHLASCEDCRAEVAELRETAALLAETVATAPPASLRDSVLAGISQVRPLAPEVPAHAAGRDEGSAGDHPGRTERPTPDAPDTRAGDAGRGDRARRRSWLPLLVAAVLALVVGVGALAMRPWADSEEVKRLTAAEQVLQAPDAEEVFVDLGEAGRATVTRSKSQDRAVITTEDMVSAPAGKDYELWFIEGDDYVSAGLMPDDPDQTVVLDGSASSAVAVGITVEPDGGSQQPTDDPIVVFDLTEAT